MGTFRPKISHKKLITYPLNPKISWGELGTSPPFVPVKERPTRYDSVHYHRDHRGRALLALLVNLDHLTRSRWSLSSKTIQAQELRANQLAKYKVSKVCLKNQCTEF